MANKINMLDDLMNQKGLASLEDMMASLPAPRSPSTQAQLRKAGWHDKVSGTVELNAVTPTIGSIASHSSIKATSPAIARAKTTEGLTTNVKVAAKRTQRAMYTPAPDRQHLGIDLTINVPPDRPNQSLIQNVMERRDSADGSAYSHFGVSEYTPKVKPPTPTVVQEVAPPAAHSPGPSSATNSPVQNQSQFSASPMAEMGNWGMVGAAAGLGVMGGVVSVATGGEFGQGAAAGATIGFGARALKSGMMTNMAEGGGINFGKHEFTKKFSGDGAWATAGSALNMGASSIQTARSRSMMMGGAALGGGLFGGNRDSHSRGFNEYRGNRF
jgi:hypothetical protein